MGSSSSLWVLTNLIFDPLSPLSFVLASSVDQFPFHFHSYPLFKINQCLGSSVTYTMFPGEDRWYFSREEIENNSPSRGDGIDLKEETRLRKSYCSLLKDLGIRFSLHPATVATAMVFCHRFFLRQSHSKNDRWTIAIVCMFLAGKVESTPFSYGIVALQTHGKWKILKGSDGEDPVGDEYGGVNGLGKRML